MSHEFENGPVEAEADVTPEVTTSEPAAFEVDSSPSGQLASMSEPMAGGMTEEQLQQAREKLYWLLTVFPEQVGAFFGEYKQPLTTLFIILATVPFVALAVAILEVINVIPFLAPTFQLVGFGYTSWFIYRYLLFADRRQEFSQTIDDYKARILGDILDTPEGDQE